MTAAPATATPLEIQDLAGHIETGRAHQWLDALCPTATPGLEPARPDPRPETRPETRPDPPATLTAVQVLAGLDLGDAARTLARTLDSVPAIDQGALTTALAAVPAGTIPWRNFERRCRENLAIFATAERRATVTGLPFDLETIAPDTAVARLGAILSEVTLMRDRHGSLRAARFGPTGWPSWIGGFIDARGERTIAVPRSGGWPSVPLVLGLGTSRVASRAWETSPAPPGTGAPPVSLLEPDLAGFAAWMHVWDLRSLLADPRVLIDVGPGAVDRWADRLRSRDGLPLHGVVLSGHPSPPWRGTVRRIRQACAAERETARVVAAHRVDRRLAHLDGPALADRLARPEASVVGFVSRHTTMLKYAMRDLGDAITALGHRFTVIEERDPGDRHQPHQVTRALADADADLVVAINRLRPAHPPLFASVPLLSVVLDPVDEILCHDGAAQVGPRDVLLGFYAQRAHEAFGYPRDRYLPLGMFPVNDQTFHDGPVSDDDAARFTCDVAYVGHFHGRPDAWHDAARERYPESLHPVLDHTREMVLDAVHRGEHVDLERARALVDTAASRCGLDVADRAASNIASFYAHRLFDIAFRLEALEWAADWCTRNGRTLHLYGRGWETDPRLGAFARGAVDHTTEARAAYRGAGITLQLLPSGIAHQRTSEALLSGSLIIGRANPADLCGQSRAAYRAAYGDGAAVDRILPRLGFRDVDELLFEDEASLGALLDRWLGHATARTERVGALAACVREHLTWRKTIERAWPDVLEAVRGGPAD